MARQVPKRATSSLLMRCPSHDTVRYVCVIDHFMQVPETRRVLEITPSQHLRTIALRGDFLQKSKIDPPENLAKVGPCAATRIQLGWHFGGSRWPRVHETQRPAIGYLSKGPIKEFHNASYSTSEALTPIASAQDANHAQPSTTANQTSSKQHLGADLRNMLQKSGYTEIRVAPSPRGLKALARQKQAQCDCGKVRTFEERSRRRPALVSILLRRRKKSPGPRGR